MKNVSIPKFTAELTRDILTSMLESDTFNKNDFGDNEKIAGSIGTSFDTLAKSIYKTLTDINE